MHFNCNNGKLQPWRNVDGRRLDEQVELPAPIDDTTDDTTDVDGRRRMHWFRQMMDQAWIGYNRMKCKANEEPRTVPVPTNPRDLRPIRKPLSIFDGAEEDFIDELKTRAEVGAAAVALASTAEGNAAGPAEAWGILKGVLGRRRAEAPKE